MFGTIAELRVGLLRLVGTERPPPELVGRGEAVNAAIDDALLVGLGEAQRYLIDVGAGDDWLTTAALTFAAEDAVGIRAAPAPTDLLRFAGDAEYPAIYNGASGTPWGQLLRDKRRRRYVTGDAYWWADGKINAARLAAVPDSVYLDYYQSLALPVGSATVDMPERARPLIVAEAGYHAMLESWIPKPDGLAAVISRITQNRATKRVAAVQALRVDDGRQNMNEPRSAGPHYFLR